MMKGSRILACIIVFLVLTGLLVGIFAYQKLSPTRISSSNNDTGINVAEYTSDELLGEYSNYTAKIDLNNMTIEAGSGLTISDTTITISNAGVYYFTGKTTEGNIVVNADNQEVVLVFDNVDITCNNTSVVNVVDAKKVTVNIPEGTNSTFTDGTKYSVFTEDDEPNATIFSKDDLTIDGKGTLVINANYEDAIASKDGLKIVSTTLNITSTDDAIRGKDYVAIKNANITIKTKGKAIKATEDSDTSLGYILIDGGTFNIESEDDAIHASNKVIINDGILNISTDDDGIHADSSICINGGTIDIAKSYEGIEANYIEINGGDITIVASDDGININGGNDSFGMRKQDSFATISDDDSNRMLVINGGNICVESNGDGLDSNGSIKMTGGNVIVGGSTNGGNSALDYDKSFEISGGSLIAYGPTGMWQNPSNSSTQYTIAFETTGKNGDKVELKDSNGNTIASFTAKRSFGMVCISKDDIKQGETYTLYINDGEIASQEITSIVTSNATSQGFMGGGFGEGGREKFGGFSDGSGDSFEGFQMKKPEDITDENRPDFPDGERPEMPADFNGEMPSFPGNKGDRKIKSESGDSMQGGKREKRERNVTNN